MRERSNNNGEGMPGLTVKVVQQDIAAIEAEALVVGCFEDVRPLRGMAGRLDWLLCGALSDLLVAKKLRGARGEVALLTTRGKVPARKIFLVGLGPKDDFSLSALRSAMKIAMNSLCGAGVNHAALEFFHPEALSFEECAAAAHEGMLEGGRGRRVAVSLVTTDRTAHQQLSRIMKYSAEQEHRR